MGIRKKGRTIKYVSSDPLLQDWIRDFADHLHTHPDKDTVIYPESFATGYARVFDVSRGLTCRLVDYKLNSDFLFERTPVKDFYLILYLYTYKNCEHLELEINNRPVIRNENSDYSSLLLTNSLAHQRLAVTRNTLVQGLTIQISRDWLKDKLKFSGKVNMKLLEEKDVFQTLIKPRYRTLFTEIFAKKPATFVPDLYLSARVMRLLELFFNEILKNGLEANVLPASSKDVQSLFEVEQFLLQSYREHFPSIQLLSRKAMMSSSKLKQTFKRAFGCTLFEYYQRNRMARAREMLLSGLYSVSEVGQMLGYHNLSNFSSAFKKEFGVLPKYADNLVF